MDEIAKLPPHNLDAEMSVLGSMMLSKEAIENATEHVTSDDFYKAAHREIFAAILQLDQANTPVDNVTLCEALRAREQLSQVGGAAYLSQMLNMVPTWANAAYYAKIVKEKALLRRLISLTGEVARDAYEPQAQAEILLDEAEAKVLQLSQFRATRPYVAIKDLLKETYDQLETICERRQPITGVPTGFNRLDEYTSGFQPSDLIIVAARPSMGKTAFCLNIAINAAQMHPEHRGVLIFSLEMSRSQLMRRILCSEARIDGQKIRSGYLATEDWTKLAMTSGVLDQLPVFLDDSSNAPLLEIRSKARRCWAQEKIGMIVIDYLQLITYSAGGSNGENRQQEISSISRSLKGLARELNVPIVCLSQLSRSVESRTDKRPILSDLRESGAIEQDADVVLFLYRDSYYNPKKEESRNKAEVIIAKQRNGPVGSFEMGFFSEFARFDNLDNTHTGGYE